jgi:uncharacterized membrane protein (DUF485 family)
MMSPMPDAHPSRRASGALRFWLFGLYLACYLAYTILTAFNRPLMASAPFGGANLAVLSGFGLIGAALALALLYWWLCRDAAGTAARPGLPAGKAGR